MIESIILKKNAGNGNGYDAFPFPIYPLEEQKAPLSYGSIDEKLNMLNIPLASDYGIEKKSQTAISIMRTFYTKKINESLKWLSQNHETPLESTHYIQPLLENLKKYKEDYFEDPFSSFLSALYDSLVFNDSWINLKKGQFSQLIKIIIPLNNNPKLDYENIDKAINKLEKLGLDTTPF
ncbi:MAG: hypothetical protein KAW56_03240 [Candidatus Marinimicrobia bacterium]|nr:hypothetical protein [Candidatus Neomarinimicrobiota bacterium]